MSSIHGNLSFFTYNLPVFRSCRRVGITIAVSFIVTACSDADSTQSDIKADADVTDVRMQDTVDNDITQDASMPVRDVWRPSDTSPSEMNTPDTNMEDVIQADISTAPSSPPRGTGNLHELPVECQKPIVAGKNDNWEADSHHRSFFVDFPTNASIPPALLFSFHGYGDSPENFRSAIHFNPDMDPSFPLIIVTPFSTKLSPLSKPQGLDWELTNGSHQGKKNRDAVFVQSVVACLKKQNNVDIDRIYTFGFSAGSVFSALLHTTFQADFAAILGFSGMWFNDPKQIGLINRLIPLKPTWDKLDSNFSSTLLQAHGGPSDKINLVVSLHDTGKLIPAFLSSANRSVVYCTHNKGHTTPPKLTKAAILQFLKDHKRGQPSPYLSHGMDSVLTAADCTLVKPK